MEDKLPWILTLGLEEEDIGYFNKLRSQYFPAERNFIDAHLTLFHALPPGEAIMNRLSEAAARQRSFNLEVLAPVSIGRGVAFKLRSDELLQLHLELQKSFLNQLTAQDRQGIWPHITVQNKVSSDQARELQATLQTNFKSFSIRATGLQLWQYLGGPWRRLQAFQFETRV